MEVQPEAPLTDAPAEHRELKLDQATMRGETALPGDDAGREAARGGAGQADPGGAGQSDPGEEGMPKK
jgi:hypothetical protein